MFMSSVIVVAASRLTEEGNVYYLDLISHSLFPLSKELRPNPIMRSFTVSDRLRMHQTHMHHTVHTVVWRKRDRDRDRDRQESETLQKLKTIPNSSQTTWNCTSSGCRDEMSCVWGRSEIKQRERREEQRDRKMKGGGMLGMNRDCSLAGEPSPFLYSQTQLHMNTCTHPCGICVYVKEPACMLSRMMVYVID